MQLQGHEVNALMSTSNQAGYSNFTYWVPAPPPPSPVTSSDSILDSGDSEQPDPIAVSIRCNSSPLVPAMCLQLMIGIPKVLCLLPSQPVSMQDS